MDKILRSRFTAQWVAEKITESLASKAELKSWSGEDINHGLGFMSEIFKMELNWKEGTVDKEDLPKSVVLKVKKY